jgi:hypothetical protein
MMEGVKADIDAGSPTPASMFLYTADRPASGATITDQVLCAQFELSVPCGTISGGTLSLTSPFIDDNLPNSGAINWGRVLNGNGDWVCDFDVGLVDDVPEPEMTLSALVVFQGGIIKINNSTFVVS